MTRDTEREHCEAVAEKEFETPPVNIRRLADLLARERADARREAEAERDALRARVAELERTAASSPTRSEIVAWVEQGAKEARDEMAAQLSLCHGALDEANARASAAESAHRALLVAMSGDQAARALDAGRAAQEAASVARRTALEEAAKAADAIAVYHRKRGSTCMECDEAGSAAEASEEIAEDIRALIDKESR